MVSRGLSGKDGSDGQDGARGADGSEIKSLDFNGTDLVMVTERGGEFKNLEVSLEPFLTTAALVTKEAHSQQSKVVIEEAEETVKKLFGHLNAHLDDQAAVPIRFYRGLWHSDVSYQVGDWVRYGSEDYLCHTANTNVAPVHGLVGQHNPADYWFRVGGAANQGGSAAGGDGGSGGPISTDQVLTRQDIPLRDNLGRFKSSERIPNLNNQLQVNRFVADELESMSQAIDNIEVGDLEGYATEDWVNEQLDNLDLDDLNQGLTQEQKIALIEAQIQFRGLMDVDADGKPIWPADQTQDRGGWWAYPSSKFSSVWNYDKLEWIFPFAGEAGDVTKRAAPEYKVGDIIQLQVSDNEAGAGTGWQYFDTAPVFVEYKVEEVYYPDTQAGNENKYDPAYRVSMSGPAHRYTGGLPTVVKGLQGDPSDAWIQWYPTTFAFGTAVPDFVPTDLTEVEERLECIEDAMPATGGVPSVPTGDLVLKITGSRPTGAAGEAGKLLMWKAEPGSGGNPYNEVKFPVDDVDAINLDATEVWFKQGDVVQKWTCGGGWFTNGNVLHISGTSTEGDILSDGIDVDMYYEDPTDCFADLISRQESKDDDRRLQAEIEQIALGLETLLTQRTHGQWKYIGFSGDNIPRNAGEFALASDDLSAAENIMTINLTDLNGTVIGLSDVEVGDYIEIVDLDEPDNYALFTCTKEPEGTGISDIELALKDKGQNFLVGETCEIRFFAVNEENINLSELDDRYLKLSGGTMGTSAHLNVNYLNPINLKHIQYSCDPSATHPEALMNRAMVQNLIRDEAPSGPPELPKFKLVASDYSDWGNGSFAVLDSNSADTRSIDSTRTIIVSAFDVDGKRWARDRDGIEYARNFSGHVNALLQNGDKTIFTMSPHYNAKCQMFYWPGNEESPHAGYVIAWQGLLSHAVTSDTSVWNVGSFYRLSIPEIFF